jgi:WD40 repeat protein
LDGHTKGVTHVLFSPDSQYLVSASYDGLIRLWGIRP